MSCDDSKWNRERLARSEEMIVAYEDAMLALANGAQSYTLDTGQTRQVVTKADLSQLRNALAFWEQRRAALRALLCGGSSVYVRPGF